MCPIPSFPLRQYSDDQRESFKTIIGRLKSRLEGQLLLTVTGQEILPYGEPRASLETCNNGRFMVQELYRLTIEGMLISSGGWASPCGAETCAIMQQVDEVAGRATAEVQVQAEAFWHAVVNGRMRILAALLFSDVAVDTEGWHRFFFYTMSDADFCDTLLLPMASSEKVKELFGHNEPLNDSIYVKQSRVCVICIDRRDIAIGEGSGLWVLPIINQWTIKDGEPDGSSSVYKVEVAEGYCWGNSRFLARKEVPFRSPEVAILDCLANNTESCRHLVQVCAIIRLSHRSKITILEELAGGDLKNLLLTRGDLNGSSFKPQVRIFKQFLGVVQGLRFFHEGIYHESGRRMVGAHLDMRPQNLIRMQSLNGEEDFWKVIDFDNSSLVVGTLENANFPVPQLGRESSSKAPENEDQICEGHRPNITPANDVWSVGTLLCIFLVWIHGGPEEYKRFEDELMNDFKEAGVSKSASFYTFSLAGNCVPIKRLLFRRTLYTRLKTTGLAVDVQIQPNPAVRKHFEGIHNGNSEFWLKAFIWEMFLAIEKHCLVANPTGRSTMREVYEALIAIVLWGETQSSR